jgi:succinyl-diaminopimelate desuccinylase
MDIPFDQLKKFAHQFHPAAVEFARHLITVPSMSGQEEEIASVIRKEMQDLAFDEVRVDRAGNIIGKVAGGDGPSVQLNGHMDHVDAGNPDTWPYPPFDAEVVDGELWGRGAVDMKGPVACMVYAASMFKQMGFTPPGDVYVTIAVMEEIGGVGTHYLTSHLQTDAAICGEPSSNILRRGHRGRVELIVEFQGQAAHASVPHLAINPHFGAAAFISRLKSLEMTGDEALGHSTVVPTLFYTDQFSPNVIPETIQLTLDWRSVPAESPDVIIEKLQALLSDSLASVSQPDVIQGRVAITRKEFITYTGMAEDFPSIFPSFLMEADNPLVSGAQQVLAQALERDDAVDVWQFATDGGHLMTAGIPTVGFGPGNEELAHTNRERISIKQMEEALIGYPALVLGLANSIKSSR